MAQHPSQGGERRAAAFAAPARKGTIMQTTNEITHELAGHPFLAGMDHKHIVRLSNWAKKVEFMPDQYLCHARHPVNRLYLMLSGRVALGLDSPSEGLKALQTLDAPAVVGISWLSPPYESCYDAKALTAVDAISINAEQLRKAIEEDHDFGHQMLLRLLAVFAERLQASSLQLYELSE